MDNGNYIKISRKILKWEWYGNINTCRLFIHCLLKANWKDSRFEGKNIERGSFVTSLPQLSAELQLTENEIRTAIKHLKSTGEITDRTTNKYRIITVKNYDEYQNDNAQTTDKSQAINRQCTGNAQTINRLLTAIEEVKEVEELEEVEENKTLTVSDDTVCQTNVQRVVSAWNSLPGLNHVSRLTESSRRYQMLKCRIREYGIEDILRAIENIRRSEFLLGANKNGWMIDFDWFVRPNNFPKVLEGKYNTSDNAKPTGKYAAIDDFLRGDFT